jgi:hypothetical protein
MTIADVLAVADADSVNVPPLSQDKADYCYAVLATARSRQVAA